MKLLLKLLTVLGALLTLSAMAGAQAKTAPLSGNWTGSLNVSGTTLHLICHFTPRPDGALSGTFDSLDQGAIGLSFSTVRVTGQTVHLEAASLGASFDGTLDAAGKTLAGHWMQGGGSLPLTLTRTDHVGGLDRVSGSAHDQGTPAPFAGAWTGSLTVPGMTLRLVFHFMPKPDGTLAATFDSPDQGAVGVPFSTARVSGSAVHLEAASIGGSFDGTLDTAGKTLTGHLMQGGISFPLTLTKTTHVATLDRPQEPRPPFPYTSTDVTFPGGASGVTLGGTLTTPPGAGPFPAVVLIAGSGPNDRDETGFGHKIFLLLADTLTRRGIAVLRYDKRGVSKSTGSYALATTADFAADAEAAVMYLTTQGQINPKKIGLLGHSEGGLIAPLVASQHSSEIAFIVLLAGPGMNGEKILLAQSALIDKAEGSKESEIAQDDAQQKQLYAIITRETDPAVAQVKAQAVILADMTPKDRKEVSDPVQFAKKQSQSVTSPWFRYFLTYDPKPALEKTRCPVLALDGSKDLQVPPAEDLALIGQALLRGGNTNVTIRELPNLNHLFQTCRTGSPSEYAKITETMAPSALAIIGDWVAGQTDAK